MLKVVKGPDMGLVLGVMCPMCVSPFLEREGIFLSDRVDLALVRSFVEGSVHLPWYFLKVATALLMKSGRLAFSSISLGALEMSSPGLSGA